MFRKREINEPAHLRDDYRLESLQSGAVPWQAAPNTQSRYSDNDHNISHTRQGMTTLTALEVIRRRFEAAQRETCQQRAA